MNLYLVVGCLMVTGVALCGFWARKWLKKLEVESLVKPHEAHLEPPASEKVALPSVYADASRSLTIVVPAYNEEMRLQPTMEETMTYLRQRRDREGRLFTYEVIVVDDGSTDDTPKVISGLIQKYGSDSLRLLRLRSNKGKGYAVRAGMLSARGKIALFMDADGATKVSDIEKLEASLQIIATGSEDGPLGMVVGSRAHLEDDAIATRHWYRNLLMRGFHLLVLFVAGGRIRDTQCGFKLFSRQAVRILYSNQRLQRWCFDVELLYLARRCSVPIGEVAVTWREIPGSKIRFTSILHMSWELLATLLGYVVTKSWCIRLQEKKRI